MFKIDQVPSAERSFELLYLHRRLIVEEKSSGSLSFFFFFLQQIMLHQSAMLFDPLCLNISSSSVFEGNSEPQSLYSPQKK